jgi:hypothetical protein
MVGSRCNPVALFVCFTGVRATMTAKGEGRDHSGKMLRNACQRSLTTEKMLSANRILSNIFLQRGQNIEFTDKKSVFGLPNFGSWGGLAFY